MSKNLSYADLQIALEEHGPKDHRKDHVTVYIPWLDEYFPVSGIRFYRGDVLDEGHAVLDIDDGKE